MRADIDDLGARAERLLPRVHRTQNDYARESGIATVWLVFYLLALGGAAASPILARAIDVAARL